MGESGREDLTFARPRHERKISTVIMNSNAN